LNSEAAVVNTNSSNQFIKSLFSVLSFCAIKFFIKNESKRTLLKMCQSCYYVDVSVIEDISVTDFAATADIL